jgi:hypothetical protein
MRVKTLLILALLGGLTAGSSRAQMLFPPGKPGAANQLTVQLWVPRMTTRAPAPATLHLFARVSPTVPAKKGDTVAVEFFSGTKRLGTEKGVWHDAVRPDPQSTRPQPMIIVPAGFSPAELVWSNAPAGTYALTARATQAGATAVSAPVSVTIAP